MLRAVLFRLLCRAVRLLCRAVRLPCRAVRLLTRRRPRGAAVPDEAVLVEPCIEEGFPRNLTVYIGHDATFECLGSWDWEMDLFWVFSGNQTVQVRDLTDMDRLNQQAINQHQVGLTDRPPAALLSPDLALTGDPCSQCRRRPTRLSPARRVTRPRWWAARFSSSAR